MAKTLGPFRLSIDDDGPDQAPLGHRVIARLVGSGALKATAEVYDLGRRCRVPVADILFDHAAGPDDPPSDPPRPPAGKTDQQSSGSSTTSRHHHTTRKTPIPGRPRRTSGRIHPSGQRQSGHRPHRKRPRPLPLLILIAMTAALATAMVVLYAQTRNGDDSTTTTVEPNSEVPGP